jgi:leucyl aminopeptidase
MKALPAPNITFKVTQRALQSHQEGCEALVFCHSGHSKADFSRFPEPIADVIQQVIIKQLDTGTEALEVMIPSMGLYPFPYLIFFYNKERPLSLQRIRELGASTSRLAAQYHLHHIAVDLSSAYDPNSSPSEAVCIGAWTEGILLGSYTIQSYKQSEIRNDHPLQRIEFVVDQNADQPQLERSITKAIVFSDATNYARDLTNMPSNMLTPSALAGEARNLADMNGLLCHVLSDQEIVSLGMGGLTAVGQGSLHPPHMIVMHYRGSEQSDVIYGLVGKGITFDTGGISLKKADGMEEMISDMGGAAVVLGVMQALGRLKPALNVVAVIPVAENMPSGSAYKPGDIISSMSGRTIEVLNTDAEGRIVLADAITYARQLGATKLIDVATLTGAVLIALGDVATAAITNNEAFLGQLMKAAEQSGERLWQLPVYPEYKEMLKSSVADLKNSTSTRWAGAITAGLFIGTFADDVPWVHLDTGGTAWLSKARGMDPQGATGAMVRTLLYYLHDS